MKKKLAAVAIAALVLTACSAPAEETPETTMKSACDAFAFYVQEGDGPEGMDRKTTVEQVRYEMEGKPAPDQRLVDATEGLERMRDGNEPGWVLAADVFAKTCMDLGWEAQLSQELPPGTRVRSKRDSRLGTVQPQARFLPMVRIEWDDGEVTYDAVDFLEPAQ